MSDFVLFVLALVACHRIWHREDIFAWPRAVLQSMGGLAKPLWCASCSPIWLGAGLALAWSFLPAWAVWALAAYPVVRLLAFMYTLPWSQLRSLVPAAPAQPAARPTLAPQAARTTASTPLSTPPAAPSCAPCSGEPAQSPGDPAVLDRIKERIHQEAANARSAATAEITVAVSAEAPESDLRCAVELVRAFQRHGLSSRLLGLLPSQGEASTAALLSNSQELDPGDVLHLKRSQGLPLADVLLLAGHDAKALSHQAAIAGVLRVSSAPRHVSEGDSSTLILASLDTEVGADEAAGRIVDLLLPSPIYRARKTALRA